MVGRARGPVAPERRCRARALDAAAATPGRPAARLRANVDVAQWATVAAVSCNEVSSLLMALRVDASGGLMLPMVAPYDEVIADRIRTLPRASYRRRSQDWCVPARRAGVRAVCALIAELKERRWDIEISKDANARIARADIVCVLMRDDSVEIVSRYSRRRLHALRFLPERRYDADRGRWTIPLTRAGALALLAHVGETDEFVVTDRARRALDRVAAPAAPTSRRISDSGIAPKRRSPLPHWRHYTAGPVFENPARPRLYVRGIGWCVRIRVGPSEPKGMA